jgi:hypothetical protein
LRFLIYLVGGFYILVMLSRIDTDGWYQIAMWAAGIVVVLILLVICLLTYNEKHYKPENYEVWNGEMTCNACDYQWQSRRKTPPGRCASCSSNNIEAVQETKTRMVPKIEK